MLVGTGTAVALVVLGPSVMGANALFPLANPGIVSVPVGFLTAVVVTLLTAPDKELEEKFTELAVRAQTGLGAEF